MTFVLNPYRFASASQTLVYDEFTDTNGVDLTAHAPDIDSVGSGWVNSGNIIGISSNRAIGETTFARAAIDCGQSDVVISANIAVGTTNGYYVGLIGRWQDDGNCWRLYAIWNTGNTGSLTLYSIEATTATARATTAITTYSSGTEYPLRLEFSGTDITGVFNDNETVSFSSSLFQSETHAGIAHRTGSASYYADNFLVMSG